MMIRQDVPTRRVDEKCKLKHFGEKKIVGFLKFQGFSRLIS